MALCVCVGSRILIGVVYGNLNQCVQMYKINIQVQFLFIPISAAIALFS